MNCCKIVWRLVWIYERHILASSVIEKAPKKFEPNTKINNIHFRNSWKIAYVFFTNESTQNFPKKNLKLNKSDLSIMKILCNFLKKN